MNIVILGAGQVGTSAAERLISEDNDITVVDIDADKLQALQDKLDLRTVRGYASNPSVLRDAGLAEADLLLAVTQSDETNMLACRIAATLFDVPTKIARIRSADYLAHPQILAPQCLGINYVISPETEVTAYLERLIDFPEALQVLEFAGGRVRLAAIRVDPGGPLAGKSVASLRKEMPQLETRVAAIFRKDRAIPPEGPTIMEEGDEMFFVAARENVSNVLRTVHGAEKVVRRVMIGGGGNIGRRLARSLEGRCEVKIIERNEQSCRMLAHELGSALVLHGEATDEALLVSENIDDMDVFLALTNDDEDNIIASLLAKKAGAHKVIALVNRTSYVDLVQGGKIDIAVSPAQATIGTLLARVRSGNLAQVHALRLGAAEAVEVVVQGGRTVGRRLGDSNLPRGMTVGAIVRGEEVIIAHRDSVIELDDHVIVFVMDKHLMKAATELFQA